MRERGLSDGICLPAQGLDRTGSLLHSFPLPGIDLPVCRDPELPLVCARSAPCSAVWELRLWAPPSPSAGGFCFCGDAEVTGSFACAVKQVNSKAAASYTQGALIRDTLVAPGGCRKRWGGGLAGGTWQRAGACAAAMAQCHRSWSTDRGGSSSAGQSARTCGAQLWVTD